MYEHLLGCNNCDATVPCAWFGLCVSTRQGSALILLNQGERSFVQQVLVRAILVINCSKCNGSWQSDCQSRLGVVPEGSLVLVLKALLCSLVVFVKLGVLQAIYNVSALGD